MIATGQERVLGRRAADRPGQPLFSWEARDWKKDGVGTESMGRGMEVSPWLLLELPGLQDLGTSWAGQHPLKKREGSQGTEERGL